MNLAETVYLMVQKGMKAAQLSDLVIGTVTSEEPLEITVNGAAAPLKRQILLLTEAVIEKKIPILAHGHTISGLGHSHTVSGLGHLHNTAGLGHTHETAGLGHTHTVEGGATGSALNGNYPSGDALNGSYPSDTQLSGSYPTSSALGDQESGSALGNIVCYENGSPLPVENGYIILNRALEVGDGVLMLRVQNGQRFIVLSRIF